MNIGEKVLQTAVEHFEKSDEPLVLEFHSKEQAKTAQSMLHGLRYHARKLGVLSPMLEQLLIRRNENRLTIFRYDPQYNKNIVKIS